MLIRTDRDQLKGNDFVEKGIGMSRAATALPPHGFKLAVLPLKIKGASAAPARVVAILED